MASQAHALSRVKTNSRDKNTTIFATRRSLTHSPTDTDTETLATDPTDATNTTNSRHIPTRPPRRTQRLVAMPAAKTSAGAQKGARFQMLVSFNSGAMNKMVTIYLKTDSLKHEIEKLALEKGTTLASLLTTFEKDWEGAPTFLAHAASTPHQPSESTVVQILAHRLRRAVEKHRLAHPEEVKNEQVFKQHLQAAGGVVVEAVYEISTGVDGAFAPALFGTNCHELAAKITQKKRVSEKDLMAKVRFLEEECKSKDTENAELNTILDDMSKQHQEDMRRHVKNMQPVEDVRLQLKDAQTLNRDLSAENSRLTRCSDAYQKKASNFELDNIKLKRQMDGMSELANKLTIASLSVNSAKTELERLRANLAHEEGSKKRLLDLMSIKTRDLRDQIKVADDRAERAEERMKSIEWAGNFMNAKIDCDLRVSDAEEFAKQEMLIAQGAKRIAKQANMRAALWQEEYTNSLNAQKKAFDCMPHALLVLFQPYITLPTEFSSAEARIELRISSSGL